MLAGTISDAVFAASLEDVVTGSAPDAYGAPATFFAATHPSGGLRTLLDEALGRITGSKPDASPTIRLETNLGGGKTHNLIALYHAARGDLPGDRIDEFMDAGRAPERPIDRIGVFVGTSAGATSFPSRDGVEPNTVWGDLALQLGGAAAYEQLRRDDEALTAPGSAVLKTIFGDQPALILLDELARYLQTAQGTTVGNSTLADQTVSFLMALLEAAGSTPRTCVVITMTETTDPFGGDTQAVLDALDHAHELIGRRATSLRPSDEADLPAILSRRLFAEVDQDAGTGAAQRYADALQDAYGRGADLPERLVSGPEFQAAVERTYPFHPALIQALDKRLSTIPTFQRTRGALRLLARTVRLLWQQPGKAELIHLHHLDLADKDIAEDLSSRIDRPRYEPVIRADIRSRAGGAPAHAEEVDQQMGAAYATRLATATYLYSLTADVPGVTSGELLGAVLAPGDDPGIVTKALDQLEQACWYLHTDARGFRFSTEWSLVKRIQEAEGRITLGKVKTAATRILTEQFRDSVLKVKRTWEDPRVPDHADDAYLVLLHWDELQVAGADDAVPAKINELWEKAPAGGNRTFRNRLVLLVPNAVGHDAMIRAVRRHLALKDLAASDLSDVSPEKRTELKQRAAESDAEARIAVCNHVNVLYVPEATGLEAYGLDQVTQASLLRNQTDAVVERLSAMEKTLASGDKPLDPAYVHAKLGAQADRAISTEEVGRVFARRADLKLVLDKGMLRTLVSDGVRQGVWEYQDLAAGEQGWATAERPNVHVRLADDTLLHPPGSAPAVGPVACPLCGQVHDGPCPDAKGGAGGPRAPPPAPAASTFEAEGSAPVAFANAKQAAVDAGRSVLTGMRATVHVSGEGTGQQLARLHALAPTSGARLHYHISAQVQLDEPGDLIELKFSGTPSDYQPLKAALAQLLGSRQAVLEASLDARFDPAPALSGQEVEDLRRRAADTGPAHCRLWLTTEADA
ncbi:MAG: DUF499 domain-containing protein [Nitriliruptorales bacterium]